MAVKNSVAAVILTSLDSAVFDGTLVAINPNGLPEACFMIRVINNSDKDIVISYNGGDGHDFVPHGQTLQIESQMNSQPNNFICKFPKGTIVYAAGTDAGTGLVFLAGYYQVNAN